MAEAAFIIMAKRPEPGQTKTRLLPVLSPVGAATLYECFLRDVVELVQSIPEVDPFIAYTPPEAESYFQQLAPTFQLLPQPPGTLGERLAEVLTTPLQAGYRMAVAVNSDSPTLPAAYLQQALDQLSRSEIDIVLGPCRDGGYYLIGWKTPQPQLVRAVPMSTPQVLQDTLALAAAADLSVALLPPWFDVDEPEDLKTVRRQIHSNDSGARHTRQFLTEQPG